MLSLIWLYAEHFSVLQEYKIYRIKVFNSNTYQLLSYLAAVDMCAFHKRSELYCEL